jgi:YVTN family beta-propeller protein
MSRSASFPAMLAAGIFAVCVAHAGQPPGPASAADTPISARDRVYAAEQFSNTVSVMDPSDNTLLGVIRLGDPMPMNFSPLYRGQLLVHGLGFAPDHRTLAVVSIGSNSVAFIETATNAIKHVTYLGRSPHEVFFTPNGREVWVTVRGEDYVSVLSATTFEEIARIKVPNGPGMQIFSPDGVYGYVCSSFVPETVVITVADRKIVGRVRQASPFCPNIAATPDGSQVWFTLKDSGRTQIFDARPPFATLRIIETGPITNHVNFVRTVHGQFAYVTVGGRNEVQVFRTDDFSKVATIQVGKLPHGIWPSGDGSRVYVGLENDDKLAVIDTSTSAVISTISIGQAPQALVYVSNAVPAGTRRGLQPGEGEPIGFSPISARAGTQGLSPPGAARLATHLTLGPRDNAREGDKPPTSVALFDQGLVQVLEASATGLEPGRPYVLALSRRSDGVGELQALASFTTNSAGAAIVNAAGQIRQVLRDAAPDQRRYLVIAPGVPGQLGTPVQITVPGG